MCNCRLCIRTREFQETLKKIPEQDQEFWSKMYDYLCEVEADLDYYKAVVEGTWPTADEVIAYHRTKEVKHEPAQTDEATHAGVPE